MGKSDEIAQISRFGVIGIAAMLCHGFSLWIWVETIEVQPVLANSYAFLMAFCVSYLGHYHWTFRSTDRHVESTIKFFVVALAGFVLNALIMYLITVIYGLSHWWGFLLIVVSIPLMTYLVGRYWVFHV